MQATKCSLQLSAFFKKLTLIVLIYFPTAPKTPQNFDIAECSDCSITVQWHIDNPDDCLDYEFEHRLQDSVTWNRLTSSISDILKVKNGYSAYKLQTLSPESFYEIRMCSVDGNVKSQYTEYKTQQTLKAGKDLIFLNF